MLADAKRNRCYLEAIKVWVAREIENARAKSNDEPILVLEIGCGSGLLSSMVAHEVRKQWPSNIGAAPTVAACEVVPKLHAVAGRTFALQESQGTSPISLLPVSHSLNVDIEGDQASRSLKSLPRRASLVVGELLDSGFIGEGLVQSMVDARDRLTTPKFQCIPASGFVLAAPVESELAFNLGGLRPDSASVGGGGRLRLRPPAVCATCAGSASAEGMHVRWQGRPWCAWESKVCGDSHEDVIKPLAEPAAFFELDFSNPPLSRKTTLTFIPTRDGTVHALVYWWRVAMLAENDVLPVMSTAPGNTACPDHWRQSVAPLNSPCCVSRGEPIRFTAFHDADMVWFEVADDVEFAGSVVKNSESAPTASFASTEVLPLSDDKPPICTCRVHCNLSRARLAALNSPRRRETLFRAADDLRWNWKQHSEPGTAGLVVVIGDGPLLPFFLASMGFHVLVIQLGHIVGHGSRSGSNGSSAKVFSEWFIHQCLIEVGVNAGLVSFASISTENSDDEEEGTTDPGTTVASQIRLAVLTTLRKLRGKAGSLDEVSDLSMNGSLRSGDPSCRWEDVFRKKLDDTEASRGVPTVALAGVLSEPWFGPSEDPGGTGGWGWEGALLLWTALGAFMVDSDDGDHHDFNDGNENGDCLGSSSGKPARTRKRQKTTASDDDHFFSSTAPLLPRTSAVGAPHLAVPPLRAVVRGHFAQCEALWDSLRPLGVVEGVDMSAASEQGADSSYQGGGGDAVSDDRGHGGGLRCAATGDASVDAVPFALAQWGGGGEGGLRPVGEPFDLLEIRYATGEVVVRGDIVAGGDAAKSAKEGDQRFGGLAHCLVLWVDYDLGVSDGARDTGSTASETGRDSSGHIRDGGGVGGREECWLEHGPGVWYGRQGVLALATPTDLDAAPVRVAAELQEDGGLAVSVTRAPIGPSESSGVSG